MPTERRNMTYQELWEQCNGIYPSYSALFDRLVEVYRANANYLPLFPGTQRLIEIARERDWLFSDESRVMVTTPPR